MFNYGEREDIRNNATLPPAEFADDFGKGLAKENKPFNPLEGSGMNELNGPDSLHNSLERNFEAFNNRKRERTFEINAENISGPGQNQSNEQDNKPISINKEIIGLIIAFGICKAYDIFKNPPNPHYIHDVVTNLFSDRILPILKAFGKQIGTALKSILEFIACNDLVSLALLLAFLLCLIILAKRCKEQIREVFFEEDKE